VVSVHRRVRDLSPNEENLAPTPAFTPIKSASEWPLSFCLPSSQEEASHYTAYPTSCGVPSFPPLWAASILLPG
jgi:hypothetical protein